MAGPFSLVDIAVQTVRCYRLGCVIENSVCGVVRRKLLQHQSAEELETIVTCYISFKRLFKVTDFEKLQEDICFRIEEEANSLVVEHRLKDYTVVISKDEVISNVVVIFFCGYFVNKTEILSNIDCLFEEELYCYHISHYWCEIKIPLTVQDELYEVEFSYDGNIDNIDEFKNKFYMTVFPSIDSICRDIELPAGTCVWEGLRTLEDLME